MYGAGREISGTKERSAIRSNEITHILSIYFSQIDFSLDDSESKFRLTTELVRFFSSSTGQHILSQVKGDDDIFFLAIDFQHFQKVCELGEFYATLEEKPKEALLCMSSAVHKVLSTKGDGNKMEDSVKINIRLHNYPESMIALKNLKAAYIDRLVSVRGTVVKVSTVRPLVIRMSFSCTKCGTLIRRDFPDGKFSPPSVCVVHGCKSRTFNPVRSTALPIDFQKLRLQELLKAEHHEEGRVPRTVECELTEDLVDTCIPGDVVTGTGIIKVINNYMDIG